jgi:glycosyltransferase involved in cell wall biosynthesis
MGHREGFEVIVFDNGSDGREVRLILHTHAQRKKIPIRIIHQKPNIGFSRGFNKAVQHADGNHIFLISDDVVIYGDIIEPATRHPWDDVLIGHRMIPGDFHSLSGRILPRHVARHVGQTRRVR